MVISREHGVVVRAIARAQLKALKRLPKKFIKEVVAERLRILVKVEKLAPV